MEPDRIDVCVCTFRRDSLAATIRSIAEQRPPCGARIRIIVADNDATPSAQSLARAAADESGAELLYVHAPHKNISIARNAALAHATAELVAFIDDDEVASPGWLGKLVATVRETGADIVLGPVQAVYGETAQAWLRSADLHSIKPVLGGSGEVLNGYTSNVLFRGAVLAGHPELRFDEALGRSGGEDTVFFDSLRRAGARFAFCPDAAVFEAVPRERETMGYLLKRAFRMGQTHARMLIGRGANVPGALSRLGNILLAAGKCVACLMAAAFGLVSTRWRRQLFRATLHAGVVAHFCGWRDLTLY